MGHFIEVKLFSLTDDVNSVVAECVLEHYIYIVARLDNYEDLTVKIM